VRILVDTSILARDANRSDPLHAIVAGALSSLTERGATLCVCSQNLYEFWVVATRPAGLGGLGMEPPQARAQIEGVLDAYEFIEDPPDLVPRWLELCTTHGVRGKPAHDARLVAVMGAAGVRDILTLNSRDFVRFAMVRTIDPLQ
jgi:predicted nucleic acid-binding protein